MLRSKWIVAVALMAAQLAFAQGEEPADAPAEAPKAAAPAPAPAAPAVVPAVAKPAAEEKEAATEVKPAAAEVKPAAVETKPAALDVRPAAATVKRKKPTEETTPAVAPRKLSREQEEEQAHQLVERLEAKTKSLPPPDTELAEPSTPKQLVEATARDFFLAVMNGDARTISLNAATPFMLEDQRITDQDELFQQWLKHLRTKRTDLLVLYGIEVLSSDEMEQRYGKPPERLASLPWKNSKTYVAIGNLSGHAAIALFREIRPSEFFLVGYTD